MYICHQFIKELIVGVGQNSLVMTTVANQNRKANAAQGVNYHYLIISSFDVL